MPDKYSSNKPALKNSFSSALPAGFVLRNSSNGQSYTIKSLLGKGGFGNTYHGIWHEKNIQVAIKEFFPDKMVSRERNGFVRAQVPERDYAPMTTSFLKEIYVLNRLRGLPCVVEVYDCFYANNTAYYVMEYVSGQPLNKYLAEKGLLYPDSACLAQFRQLMRDLSLLHDNSIIHRDISPDNIMWTNSGRLKLIDFGSARVYDNGMNLTVNLKKEFAPPEQYSSSGQGAYTDIYALAATMYYAFSGKVLPDISERLRRPDALVLDNLPLDNRQKAALKKAMSLKPKDRFQSMSEFEEAFMGERKFGQGPEEIPAGRPAISVELLKSQPISTALSGLMFLLALLVYFVL